MKKYKAKVSATVEMEAIIVENANGDKEIDEILEVEYIDEFENVRPLR